jgi:hypothetical protein
MVEWVTVQGSPDVVWGKRKARRQEGTKARRAGVASGDAEMEVRAGTPRTTKEAASE